jgi:hypothetical protein
LTDKNKNTLFTKDIILPTIVLISMMLVLAWFVSGYYSTLAIGIESLNQLELSDCEISNIEPNKWKPTNGTLVEKSETCTSFINEGGREHLIKTFEQFRVMLFPGILIISVILWIAIFVLMVFPTKRLKDDKND